jgi:two-component system, cell cycle response regulator CpdR
MSRVTLIVDDDPSVLELIGEMMEELGHEVVGVQSSMEALAALEENRRIDILIADMNMPGIAGYNLAQVAKRLRPSLKTILMSGRETDSRGFRFLRKPFLQADLARVIKETTAV